MIPLSSWDRNQSWGSYGDLNLQERQSENWKLQREKGPLESLAGYSGEAPQCQQRLTSECTVSETISRAHKRLRCVLVPINQTSKTLMSIQDTQ